LGPKSVRTWERGWPIREHALCVAPLMEEWHPKSRNLHQSRDHRRRHLLAYLDWYNQVRVHQSLESTPLERLELFTESVNNAC
jgi:hypothetical protein